MQVIAHYDSRTGLSGNQISSIYEDATHNIWIGCQFDGLNKLDAHTHKITTYTSASSGLTSDRVRCFAEWKGELLIGTFDGVFVYRSATDRIDKVGGYDKPRRGLGHFSVYSFCLDRIGTLWIGTYGGGVTWLSSLTGRFEHHTLGMDQNLRVGTYGTACVDKQNRLWVATEGYGLLYYDITTKDGKFYPISAGHSVSSSNIIKTIYAEADCIWCGTVLGEIYRFDLATRRFSLFYRYPVEAAIFGILRDKEGNLWVGTSKAQHTLTCFTPTDERKSYLVDELGKIVHRVTEKEGLMGGDICKLLEGGDGKLWMSSLQGISSYSPSTGEIRNFPFENGIHLREFTVRGGVAMPDGTLCFTGNDAFLTFYSPDMPVNTFLPPVVLEDLSVNNKSVKLGDGTGILDRLLNEEKTIRLRYNQNNLSISYKALNQMAYFGIGVTF